MQSWGDCCKWTVIRADFGCLPVPIHLVFGCRFDAYSEDTVFDCLVFCRILAEMDSPPRCLGMLYTGQITERALPQIIGPVSGVSGVTSNGLGVHFILCVCNYGQCSAILSVGTGDLRSATVVITSLWFSEMWVILVYQLRG